MKTKGLKMLVLTSILSGFTLLPSGCKKEEDPVKETPKGNLSVQMNYAANGKALLMDSLLFKNAAGNAYKVSNLEYFISGVQLNGSNNEKTNVDGVFYFNSRNANQSMLLKNIPVGSYTGISFSIGVVPSQNIFGNLDSDPQIVNMQWPEPLGGGYHFLKFEGKYVDSTDKLSSFLIHLGGNDMLVNHQLISTSLNITENATASMQLEMDMNQWFADPYTYDFEKDGNYTMAITPLMTIIKNNGHDVFHLKN